MIALVGESRREGEVPVLIMDSKRHLLGCILLGVSVDYATILLGR